MADGAVRRAGWGWGRGRGAAPAAHAPAPAARYSAAASAEIPHYAGLVGTMAGWCRAARGAIILINSKVRF